MLIKNNFYLYYRMITYSFKITSVNRLILYVDEDGNEFNNVITKINFYYQGIDDDKIKAIYNSCIILPKPTSSNYKNYNELTEADIISWIESLISTEDITLMQTVINSNIQDIKTTTSSLPWQT